MISMSARKVRVVASVALIGLAIALLVLVRPQSGGRGVEVRVVKVRQSTNGALVATLVLTNTTRRTFNIVNDVDGNPLFILDHGGPYPADSYGAFLTRALNNLKLNLAAATSLTNRAWITNPPPRFRLSVLVRDLAAERRDAMVSYLLPDAWAAKFTKWREGAPPTSPWIETKMAEP